MRIKPLSIAAILSLALCLLTLVLWIVTTASTRRIIIRISNPSVYAWHEGIALRRSDRSGVRSWDLDYLSVTGMTLVLPVLCAWRRWRPKSAPTALDQALATHLRKRIDFFLPTAVVVAMMFGVAAMAVEVPAAWFFVTAIEVALVANLVARQKLKTQMKWLLAGRCPVCGYDLTANVSGTCPECGTSSPASV